MDVDEVTVSDVRIPICELMEYFPILWDKQNPNYSDKNHRTAEFKEIANRLQLDVNCEFIRK